MGRSSGYCFKIIVCGGSSSSESVDRDDLDASSENKGSDKKGWSFRKRSAEHRVVSNTVITNIPSSENKISEPVIINSQSPVISSLSEKSSANQWTQELPRVSTSTNKGSTTSKLVDDDIKLDSSPDDESFVIVIQAAVRKFLAQKELVRLEKVVKLQAAIRGHLVRCRAAGTLRCIQAIVKMQALVRVRHASMSIQIGKKGIRDSKTKPHPTYISIEKLLSNRFAIQLLESTPRTKQINIKCDPSKDDASWKWLERWMSVSAPEIVESHAPKPKQEKVVDPGPEIGPTLFLKKPIVEAEQPEPPAKQAATEQTDSEGRKSVLGSRKVSNPSFIAAHSKFEELTSKNNSLTSVKRSNQEHVMHSHSPAESFVYESLKVGQSQSQSQTGGSECGTELSVTSMLDSPDPSEVGNIEYEKQSKVLNKAADDIKSISVEEHDLFGTELTHSILELSEKYDNKTDVSQSNQNGSPKSHITAPESQQTPSSQISNNKKIKSEKKVSSQKSKSWSNSKKSPVSFDHLPRESKPGNRRNSFGSQCSDQEPRDSSSSNSIPSYMQVTESARAKVLGNNSPRSSPDINGREAYMKKRHSLPGAVNGRHGSPRIKRSSPQAQQTTKGSDNREKKWQN